MQNIKREIIETFNNSKIPQLDDSKMNYLDWERKEVINFFKNKRWEDITLEYLWSYDGDKTVLLSLLPLEYYLYYIKSFLILSIENCTKIDLLCDTIVYSFHIKFIDKTINHLAVERFNALTKKQLEVIMKYLDYMKTEYGDIIDEWGLNEARSSVEKVIKNRLR